MKRLKICVMGMVFGFVLGTVSTVTATELKIEALGEVVSYSLSKGMQIGGILVALGQGQSPSVVCIAMMNNNENFNPSMASVDATTQATVKLFVKAFRESAIKGQNYACEWGD